MKTIKVLLHKYANADGAQFSKASIKGEYLPFADVEVEAYYRVSPVSGGAEFPPTGEGIYEIAYEDKGLWIDKRPDFKDKHIVRVRAVRIVKVDDFKK